MKHENISFASPLYLADNNPYPKTDFDTKEIIENDKGEHYYSIKNVTKGERGLEEIEITLVAPSNPVEGIEIMSAVSYKNTSLTVGKLGNGRKYYTYRADGVKAV